MSPSEPAQSPGMTQSFVLAQGFAEKFGRMLLIDQEGHGRAFLELNMDPDHPLSNPDAAYHELLSALPPGAAVRFLQILWPDPAPRRAFLQQVDGWVSNNELLLGFKDELVNHLEYSPLPFNRRTILESVIFSEEALELLEAASELLEGFGISARVLEPAEVQQLTHWFFHPELY